ncbi:hypothetical protein JTE90_001871 [Oedothorax gibbosus]|uniref:Uncharacterized protein n=1 Tax=Oedothorax gibbosus TaxID=931172 RepID=A0AAV6VPD8_9ARAC|nr:hypothetical protein JTE90_001871 [Oedothorax gibbosus]
MIHRTIIDMSYPLHKKGPYFKLSFNKAPRAIVMPQSSRKRNIPETGRENARRSRKDEKEFGKNWRNNITQTRKEKVKK